MQRYFVYTTEGNGRSDKFFDMGATFLEANKDMKYAALAQLTAEKIMKIAAPFAAKPTKENLIYFREGQFMGNWRDTGNGLGGGRASYNVNAVLVPAGLCAIVALGSASFFPSTKIGPKPQPSTRKSGKTKPFPFSDSPSLHRKRSQEFRDT
jgi:hypothetical protein